jgi:hypothetical protein
MRSGAVAFAVVFAVGLIALIAVGLARGSDLVYSPGVNPQSAILEVPPGGRACQAPLRSPDGAEFTRIGLSVTAPHPAPVRVEVLDADTNRRLAVGRLTASPRAPAHIVPVGTLRTRAPLRICVVGEGPQSVSIYGQAGIASPHSEGTLDGADAGVDFAFTLRRERRSLIALAPTMAERAGLFRPAWITPGAYLVLALLVIAIAPLLLTRGLARAAAADRDA